MAYCPSKRQVTLVADYLQALNAEGAHEGAQLPDALTGGVRLRPSKSDAVHLNDTPSDAVHLDDTVHLDDR